MRLTTIVVLAGALAIVGCGDDSGPGGAGGGGGTGGTPDDGGTDGTTDGGDGGTCEPPGNAPVPVELADACAAISPVLTNAASCTATGNVVRHQVGEIILTDEP